MKMAKKYTVINLTFQYLRRLEKASREMAQSNSKNLSNWVTDSLSVKVKKMNFELPNKALPFFLWKPFPWGLVLQVQTPAGSWWLP